MRDHALIALITTTMSMIGLAVLNSAGAETNLPIFHPWIALISLLVWLTAYHLWIKRGTNFSEKVMLAIGVPFVGTFIAVPLWGIFAFFWFWWIFIPISFITVCLLALIARPKLPTN